MVTDQTLHRFFLFCVSRPFSFQEWEDLWTSLYRLLQNTWLEVQLLAIYTSKTIQKEMCHQLYFGIPPVPNLKLVDLHHSLLQQSDNTTIFCCHLLIYYLTSTNLWGQQPSSYSLHPHPRMTHDWLEEVPQWLKLLMLEAITILHLQPNIPHF